MTSWCAEQILTHDVSVPWYSSLLSTASDRFLESKSCRKSMIPMKYISSPAHGDNQHDYLWALGAIHTFSTGNFAQINRDFDMESNPQRTLRVERVGERMERVKRIKTHNTLRVFTANGYNRDKKSIISIPVIWESLTIFCAANPPSCCRNFDSGFSCALSMLKQRDPFLVRLTSLLSGGCMKQAHTVSVNAYMHAYIHTYIHTCMHAYIHT